MFLQARYDLVQDFLRQFGLDFVDSNDYSSEERDLEGLLDDSAIRSVTPSQVLQLVLQLRGQIEELCPYV